MTENEILYFIQYVYHYRLCYICINKIRLRVVDTATLPTSELRSQRRLEQDLLICCCSNRMNQSDKHCRSESHGGTMKFGVLQLIFRKLK